MKIAIPKRHDDIDGESIAEIWHRIAEVISIGAAISGIGIAITAAAGAVWHHWAAEQHANDIARMKGKL